MKLYTFEANHQRRVGAEWSGQLVDLTVAYDAFLASQSGTKLLRAIPSEMGSFIRLGSIALEAAAQTLKYIEKRPAVPAGATFVYSFEAVKILAPLRPGKILCCEFNYRSHLEESPTARVPGEPFFFSKLPGTVIGPGEPIVKPKRTAQLDYEVEIAVIIGQKIKNIPEAQVMDALFGATILHDVSARDVQFKDHQITLGKNFDTFCPLGPCLVTRDELPNLSQLRLRATLNDVVVQDANTADWIFPLPRLISFLSHVMTLEPGDIVSTGTPTGVGLFRQPPLFLKAGDRIVLEVEGIGRLENPVINQE